MKVTASRVVDSPAPPDSVNTVSFPFEQAAFPTREAGRGELPCMDNPLLVQAAVPGFDETAANTGAVQAGRILRPLNAHRRTGRRRADHPGHS